MVDSGFGVVGLGVWGGGGGGGGRVGRGVGRVGRGVGRVGRGVRRVGRGVQRVGRGVQRVGRGGRVGRGFWPGNMVPIKSFSTLMGSFNIQPGILSNGSSRLRILPPRGSSVSTFLLS